jgi:RNA polymerase sigma-70 factor (ECF subfamily)
LNEQVADAALDDAGLMARFVATRDRSVFERLFRQHRDRMVAYAGRYVRDRARAEELAQEIFVKVYTTKTYEAQGSFTSWLYRVATNVCLNELRRPEHRQRFSEYEEQAAGTTPEAQLIQKELGLRLSRALEGLPDKQRAAFIMARMDGLRHEEIAVALSTTIPAVKSLIHRALETLREAASPPLEPSMQDRPGEVPA